MVRVLPKRNVTGFYTVSKKKTTTRSFLIKSGKKSPDFFLKLKRERKESIGGARYYSYPALPNPTQLIKRKKKKKKTHRQTQNIAHHSFLTKKPKRSPDLLGLVCCVRK